MSEYVYLTCGTCKTKTKYINIDIPTTEYFCSNTCQWRKQQEETKQRAIKNAKVKNPGASMLSECSGRKTGYSYDDYF